MPLARSSTPATSEEVLFRPAEPGDLHYILKTWIRDFKRSPFAGPYTSKRLIVALKATIADILARGTVTVACSARRPQVIFGFVVYETNWPFPLVHYVYVKGLFRSMNIGGTLLSLALGHGTGAPRYTFKTTNRHARALAQKHGMRFSPGLCRQPDRKGAIREDA